MKIKILKLGSTFSAVIKVSAMLAQFLRGPCGQDQLVVDDRCKQIYISNIPMYKVSKTILIMFYILCLYLLVPFVGKYPNMAETTARITQSKSNLSKKKIIKKNCFMDAFISIDKLSINTIALISIMKGTKRIQTITHDTPMVIQTYLLV